ncbi:MAG: hypothetical protein methR_P3947 [Methyloprofundus sp.]|nr:MAG: hypothetical protein methR_P3947 [Methyloprofundus sp.]
MSRLSNHRYLLNMARSFLHTLPAIIFIALSCLSNTIIAAEINVQIDRNPINLNESVQITFSTTKEPDAAPDFSPLEDDFEILNQSQQQSTSIVNWSKTKSIQWILTVMPKRAGTLMIPAINFGSDSSEYSALIVNKAPVQANNNADLFLQVSVNTEHPYVQEQVLYTLKLYRKVQISQAQLTEPVLENAVVEKLGEDKNYRTQHQGESYVVTERHYAIFPQQSGSMTIAPLELTASIVTASKPRFNGFFNRQNTRTKRVSSQPIKLEVRSKPANVGAYVWLPAEQVLLQEKWSNDDLQITVGEPITRTITLKVAGATSAALPQLSSDDMPANLKSYPDQPVLQEKALDDGIIALREEKIALIPSQAGSFTLPAIEIHWWNTQSKKMQVTRLAERTLVAVAGNNTTPQLPIQPAIKPTVIDTVPLTMDDTPIADEPTANNIWLWLALFFACAWLITLIYFLSNRTAKPKKTAHEPAEKSTTAVKNLKQACIKNEPIMAKDALLQWGREQFNLSNLTKIAEQCDENLQNEILALNIVLYSDKSKAWQGSSLWAAFQAFKTVNSNKKASKEDPLEPLFKI